ncbi:hypothetical protein [Lysobacter gummosus]|uniref:hypothetical protein n=1 Tax=Lysobacter gummosus TaxID=262324 RepID=UPI003641621D
MRSKRRISSNSRPRSPPSPGPERDRRGEPRRLRELRAKRARLFSRARSRRFGERENQSRCCRVLPVALS